MRRLYRPAPSATVHGVCAFGKTKTAAKANAAAKIESFAAEERLSVTIYGRVVVVITRRLAGGWESVVFDPADYPEGGPIQHCTMSNGTYLEVARRCRIHAAHMQFTPGDSINPPAWIADPSERRELRSYFAWQNGYRMIRMDGGDDSRAHANAHMLVNEILAAEPDDMAQEVAA